MPSGPSDDKMPVSFSAVKDQKKLTEFAELRKIGEDLADKIAREQQPLVTWKIELVRYAYDGSHEHWQTVKVCEEMPRPKPKKTLKGFMKHDDGA